MTYFLLAILFWVLYNLVVKFLIPVYRTGKMLKKQFDNIKQTQQQPQPGNQQQAQPQARPEREKAGEYIDFEEVR